MVSKSHARILLSTIIVPFQKSHGPDEKIIDVLPKTLKEALNGRRSSKVQKTHQFFLRFTDQVYKTPGEELWEDLVRTKCYLNLHIILFAKHDKSQEAPMVFYHAELPEIMLEMIEQSFTSDFYMGSAKMRCLPSLAMQVMTTFFYMHGDPFLVMSEKLLRGSEARFERVSNGVFDNKLGWFDKLCMVQLFGAASFSRSCIWFLHRHPEIVHKLCILIYHGVEIVEDRIRKSEINWRNETLSLILSNFRNDDDLVLTCKLFGIHSTNQAVIFMKNVMETTLLDFETFVKMGAAVMKAHVLRRFSYIVLRLMMWQDPGLYVNSFLAGVYYVLRMVGAVTELISENISHTLEHKLPIGIETFKFCSYDITGTGCQAPNSVAILFLHAFCFNSKFGHEWSIAIICDLLTNAEEKVVSLVVDHFGLDLVDLAHLVGISQPRKIQVQTVILEALLRHGHIKHKCYSVLDISEGDIEPSKDLKEYVLEAILFCKKAECEKRMSEEAKQELVMEADRVKDEGNAAFRAGNYKEAIKKYTDAIALCPLSARKKQAVYYSNRAECYLRGKNSKRAIHDCNRSLCLDTSGKVKVQWRRSRAYQKLDLDYPAWLDMKCLEKDWSAEQNIGMDFNQLLASLGQQVGMTDRKAMASIDKKIWGIYFYSNAC